jgi:hypothetical protein
MHRGSSGTNEAGQQNVIASCPEVGTPWKESLSATCDANVGNRPREEGINGCGIGISEEGRIYSERAFSPLMMESRPVEWMIRLAACGSVITGGDGGAGEGSDSGSILLSTAGLQSSRRTPVG